MKRVLGIAMVLGLVGALTVPVMAQEAKPGKKMENSWLWVKGTKFTGTTLVFTSDKKIGIKPSKEKLHIYSKNYVSNWEPNGSARIDTAIHSIFQGPAPEDYSGVTFKFENLKVDGLEMTGTCSYEIIYGFKGDTQAKKLKEDKVPVKFISSGLITITSNQPNPNNAGQPGDPKIPKDPLTEPERFDQEVLKEIQNLIKDNPGKTDYDLQQVAEKIRKKGDSPKRVAVEHYFFGLTCSYFLLNGVVPRGLSEEVAFQLTFHYETLSPLISLNPGPRGEFTNNIAKWGYRGLIGWRP